MNQCPLLLKYRYRDCYSGIEADLNTNSELLEYLHDDKEISECRIWNLLLAGAMSPMTYVNGNIRYFYR